MAAYPNSPSDEALAHTGRVDEQDVFGACQELECEDGIEESALWKRSSNSPWHCG